MGPGKPRGYRLRLRRAVNNAQPRRPVARQDPLPEPEVEADGWESVRLRYSSWGCSAPSPQERND